MNYSDDIKRKILQIRIVDILASYSRRIDYVGYGNSKKFFSPFRDENDPSFSVNIKDNTWYDHGAGYGGGVLDLIARLEGCTKSQAWEKGAALLGHVPAIEVAPIARMRKDAKVIVDKEEDFNRRGLLGYAKERGISEDILKRFCRQITYHYDGSSTKLYYGIGFPNNSEGWTLRSRNYKRSSKSGITTIAADGTYSKTPSSSEVMVFEGMFNFLSYMQMNHPDGVPGTDICVLNSVTNLVLAMDYLQSHARIGAWLDNDQAGRRALETIQSKCDEREVKDFSFNYKEHNDLNDLLMASLRTSAVQKKTL